MPQDSQTPVESQLLAAISQEEHDRLLPDLENVFLDFKQVLYEPREPISHVYFPNNAVVSLLNLMADGAAVEVGVVGYEGIVGLPVFLGIDTISGKAIVQIAGDAMRMKADVFRAEANRDGPLHRLLQRYTQALLMQVSQTAACNRFHAVEERCCRWLLMTHDRVRSDQFPITQEFLSQMLGVRRASVSLTAATLQRAGLIRYSRGKMNILDREGLEAISCECYGIVKEEFDRLLGGN